MPWESDPRSAARVAGGHGTETVSVAETLEDLTREWFLFLSTFRRNPASSAPDAEWVHRRLESLYEEMSAAALCNPRLNVEFEDVKHILVYLADEILLNSGWHDEAAWSRDLLEERLFSTRKGGKDFFDRLEGVLKGDRRGVLEVYHRALCMGFRGQLMRQPLALSELRRNLFHRINTHPLSGSRFCPEAYESIDTRDFRKLPGVGTARLIIGLFAFLLGLYFVADITFQARLGELLEETKSYANKPAAHVPAASGSEQDQ